ncbi:MAG: hypothetical protein U0936_01485 [Planctomycetaceae bacterium]
MYRVLPMKQIVGKADIVFITLDTLRFDVATLAMKRTDAESAKNHSGRINYDTRRVALPLPHIRPFCGFFAYSVVSGNRTLVRWRPDFRAVKRRPMKTFVFDAPDIVTGLVDVGYTTICVGGVGFFNKQSPFETFCQDCFTKVIGHHRWELPTKIQRGTRSTLLSIRSRP